MAARDDEGQKRRLKRLVGQIGCCDMSTQMVNRDERQVGRQGQPLCKADSDQKGTDQSRPGCDRNAVKLRQRDLPSRKCLLDYG
ncbi:hypothetical protein SDC9_137845 [bioreactor metagenome]|uniref:Uncharacterized protein n=1 Tax=bioreactor metagenome TaxID=1076179 RepID=A0A645DPM7_9ZZZZ